jgi:hypothetical protein
MFSLEKYFARIFTTVKIRLGNGFKKQIPTLFHSLDLQNSISVGFQRYF